MTCEELRSHIPLYLYAELPGEEEERFEDHLEGCASCGAELAAARSALRALDARVLEPSPSLLAECRQGLSNAIEEAGAPGRSWTLFGAPGLLAHNPFRGLRQAILLAACVGIGFFLARTPSGTRAPGRGTSLSAPETIAPAGFLPGDDTTATVRSVQPDPLSGRVRVGIQETRLRFVSGRVEDEHIRRLLLDAAGDEQNPGLRVETVAILKDHGGSLPVREVLLHALARDENAGVRLKALEGLRTLTDHAEIRKALARALVADENPGVRVRVIDLLTQTPDDALVGTFQEVLDRERNLYVRMRCQKALRDMNASEGTF
jgi:hypothetical protein